MRTLTTALAALLLLTGAAPAQRPRGPGGEDVRKTCLILGIGRRDFDRRYERGDQVLLQVLNQVQQNQQAILRVLERLADRRQAPPAPRPVPQQGQGEPIIIVVPGAPQQQIPQQPPQQRIPQRPPQQQLPQQPPQQQIPQQPPQQRIPRQPPQQQIPQQGPQQQLPQGGGGQGLPQGPPAGFQTFTRGRHVRAAYPVPRRER